MVYCLNRMASGCCREGAGVGWRGGIFLCALQHVRCVPPKHVPFSARRSCCSQSNRTVLGQTSCAGLHGRTVMGSRAWAWWRARARVGGPRWVRMHRGSSYATQMSPGSLVRRGGWGGGEKCAFMGCNVFPSPSHPIHSTAAAALSHGYWTSLFVIDP